jgi:inosine-uridine nucleoside N-ribohydrolase
MLSNHAAEAADGTGLAPVRIILDTDMSRDIDDVGALAVLHALAQLGEADILGIVVSCAQPFTVPCASAINHFYGRPDLPIGVVRRNGIDDHSRYVRGIADEFSHLHASADDAEDAVLLYRRLLAAAPDHSVVIVSIGFLTVMHELLDSPADEISALTGLELITAKVAKWVCMGGVYPAGWEFNLAMDAAASAAVIPRWPTEIHFSGLELGQKILTGKCLATLPKSNPVRRAYELYFQGETSDRPSWDQASVLYAVRGPQEHWSVEQGYHISVNDQGECAWTAAPQGSRHYFLREKNDPALAAAEIDELMIRQPDAANVVAAGSNAASMV